MAYFEPEEHFTESQRPEEDQAKLLKEESQKETTEQAGTVDASMAAGRENDRIIRDEHRRQQRAIDRERHERNESLYRVDGFTNPHEMARKFYEIDEVKADISRERAEINAMAGQAAERSAEKAERVVADAGERVRGAD